MERISDLDDSQLHNLGKITANAMIDLMIAHKNSNYHNECISIRLSECELEGEQNSWIQFQIKMQSNPLLFMQDEIELGYIPNYLQNKINLELFDASIKIINLCEVNDLPIEITNVIINQFEKTINNIIHHKK
jgi:hypothetical protein